MEDVKAHRTKSWSFAKDMSSDIDDAPVSAVKEIEYKQVNPVVLEKISVAIQK